MGSFIFAAILKLLVFIIQDTGEKEGMLHGSEARLKSLQHQLEARERDLIQRASLLEEQRQALSDEIKAQSKAQFEFKRRLAELEPKEEELRSLQFKCDQGVKRASEAEARAMSLDREAREREERTTHVLSSITAKERILSEREVELEEKVRKFESSIAVLKAHEVSLDGARKDLEVLRSKIESERAEEEAVKKEAEEAKNQALAAKVRGFMTAASLISLT